MKTIHRPSTGICGHCKAAISLVEFDIEKPGRGIDSQAMQRVREYAHDWNGSIDSHECGYHYASPK